MDCPRCQGLMGHEREPYIGLIQWVCINCGWRRDAFFYELAYGRTPDACKPTIQERRRK